MPRPIAASRLFNAGLTCLLGLSFLLHGCDSNTTAEPAAAEVQESTVPETAPEGQSEPGMEQEAAIEPATAEPEPAEGDGPIIPNPNE